jgi:hypothetical protein
MDAYTILHYTLYHISGFIQSIWMSNGVSACILFFCSTQWWEPKNPFMIWSEFTELKFKCWYGIYSVLRFKFIQCSGHALWCNVKEIRRVEIVRIAISWLTKQGNTYNMIRCEKITGLPNRASSLCCGGSRAESFTRAQRRSSNSENQGSQTESSWVSSLIKHKLQAVVITDKCSAGRGSKLCAPDIGTPMANSLDYQTNQLSLIRDEFLQVSGMKQTFFVFSNHATVY